MTKGVLVIDTEEIQSLIAITGKMPDYVPPTVAHSTYENKLTNDSNKISYKSVQAKKRNFIRENIENIRIMKPSKPLSSARRKK